MKPADPAVLCRPGERSRTVSGEGGQENALEPFVMRVFIRRSAPFLLAMAIAACSGGGDDVATSVTAPSPAPTPSPSPSPSPVPSQPACAPTLPDLPGSLPARGGTYTVTLLVGADCTWTASAQAEGWATIAPTSGRGSTATTLRVAENAHLDTRTLVVTFSGQTFRILQDGVACIYTLSAGSLEIGNDAGSIFITVTAPAGCRWTASSSDRWVTVKTPSGSGSDTVVIEFERNTGDARQGFVTIANQRIGITQQRG
jgi:hypothetical protein